MSRTVCIASDTLPPIINGTNVVLRALCQGLSDAGLEVMLVGPRQPGAPPEEALGRHVLVPSLPFPTYPEYRIGLVAPTRFPRLLDEEEIDHVHLLTPLPIGFAMRVALAMRTVPFSACFLTDFMAAGDHHKALLPFTKTFGWPYLRWFYKGATTVAVPSEEMEREVRAGGIGPTISIANGVNSERFHPGRASDVTRSALQQRVGTRSLCVYVGRLSAEKNARQLLDVAQSLPDVGFVIVGDGPERSSIERNAPPNVHLTGYVVGDELPTLIASCDLFVFPSLLEAGIGAPLEAMACGLPVIAHPSKGVQGTLVDGHNGLLVDASDIGAWRDAIAGLLDDRARREAMGRAGRATAERRSWSKSIGPLVESIEGAIRKRGLIDGA